jgi:LysM domain-containing protein
MSVLSLGKRPGSVRRPLPAKNPCPPARRPDAGVRTPVVPPAAGRPRAARLDETEFAEWPGRAARAARGGSLRAGTVPGTASGWPGRAARAGRPERILRLVQPGETARSQPLPPGWPRQAPPSRRTSAGGLPPVPRQAPASRRGPARGLVPLPRQAPPLEQMPPPGDVPPPGPGAKPAPRRWAQPGQEVQSRRAVAPGRAHQPGPAMPARPRTRLTRRGRRVLWAFATLLVAAVLTPVLLVASAGAEAANHGASPAQVRAGMRHVVVQPGQSLWSIAEQAEPHADPRTVIQQIIQYNALGSDVVAPGESLWVPRD